MDAAELELVYFDLFLYGVSLHQIKKIVSSYDFENNDVKKIWSKLVLLN